MKTIFILGLLVLGMSGQIVCAEETPQVLDHPYFDSFKLYSDADRTLYDSIEFATFDMTEIKHSDETGKNATIKDELIAAESGLPKLFYQALKSAINEQNVPVTLFAKQSRIHRKPFVFNLKVKSIALTDPTPRATQFSPCAVSVRIYGELSSKIPAQTIFKFYDTAVIDVKPGQAAKSYEQVVAELMTDFARVLKEYY